MMDRNGQLSGPGALNGLWREGAELGPAAFQLSLAYLGLGLPWLVAVLALASGGQAAWALLGAASALLAAVVLPGLALIAAQAAPVSALTTGEWRVVGRAWHQGLVVALLLGLVAVAVGALGAPLLARLGQPSELVQALGSWLFTASLGVVALLVAASTAASLLSVGRVWSVVWVVLLADLLSLLLLSLRPDALFGDDASGLTGVARVAVLVSWLSAACLVALAWWQPYQQRYGMRLAFGGLRPQSARRDGPSALSAVLVGLCWAGLALIAGALGELALATLTLLLALLLPALVVARALAVSTGRRVILVLAGAMKKPGSVSRCGQRCAWLTLLVLLGLLAVTSQAVPLLLPWFVFQQSLAALLLQCLPMALVLVLVQAACSLWVQGLRSLEQNLHADLVLAVAALISVPLAWALAIPLGTGLLGVLAAPTLCSALAALLLARWFRRAAGAVDSKAARQMQARARAIALGWADTVMVWPGQDLRAGGAGTAAARRAKLR